MIHSNPKPIELNHLVYAKKKRVLIIFEFQKFYQTVILNALAVPKIISLLEQINRFW